MLVVLRFRSLNDVYVWGIAACCVAGTVRQRSNCRAPKNVLKNPPIRLATITDARLIAPHPKELITVRRSDEWQDVRRCQCGDILNPTRNNNSRASIIPVVISFSSSTDLILIIRCELLAHAVAPVELSLKIVLIFLRIFPREPPIVLSLFCIVAVDPLVIKTYALRFNRLFGEKPRDCSPRLGTPHPVNSCTDDPLDYPHDSGAGVRGKVAVDVSPLFFFIRASLFQRHLRCI